jgi:hypothetical protein
MVKQKEKFHAVFRFSYHLQVVLPFQDTPESFTNKEVIIGDYDAPGVRQGIFPFHSGNHDPFHLLLSKPRLDIPPQILLDSGVRVGALHPKTDLFPLSFKNLLLTEHLAVKKDTCQKSILFYNKTIEELNKVNLVFLSQNTRIFAANSWKFHKCGRKYPNKHKS